MMRLDCLRRPWQILAVLLVATLTFSGPRPADAQETWRAPWISHPEAPAKGPTTLLFRRDLTLPSRPASFPVRVSADNRFILYVNGARVAAGPARGDLGHWRYERIDIAKHLRRGGNIISAVVWNDGANAPLAQISARTGFLLQAEDAAQAAIDTGPAWRVKIDPSRSVASGMLALMRSLSPAYYVAGAPETLDAAQHDWTWRSASTKGKDWSDAAPLSGPSPYTLEADALPQMLFSKIDSGRVVRTDLPAAQGFPRRAVEIPANTKTKILIDAGRVLAAYPELTVSGGKGARIKVTYSEALYDAKKQKGDRSDVGDRQALGLVDTFLVDGGEARTFAPLWWRAWRFVELDVQTGDQPLRLDRFETFETGYPFEQRGRFVSNDPQLNEIWRIGWMTALFDAHETYMDTAYWEQLQYIGDTRIQALVTYNVSGDPRLPVQALDAYDQSRVVDGLPQSAYPSRSENPIPPFALLWIGMLHDSWMYNPDIAVLQRNLPGARSVLDWYAPYVRETGLVREAPGWNFIDWAGDLGTQPRQRPRNAPTPADSCIISMLYIGALDQSAALEQAVGDASRVPALKAQAAQSRAGVQSQCWDEARGLYADTPEKKVFSQHANILAVLYDVAPPASHRALLERIVAPGKGTRPPEGLTGATYYFSFYLARAYEHAGMGDRYLELLQTWRDLLAKNFTTWPETPDPTRSDSHAWTSHPTIDLMAIVAGIEPGSPGFATVRVAPHLGALTSVDADVPHPKGLIRTSYRVKGDRVTAKVTLPRGLTGEFVWQGERFPLRAGSNRLRLSAR